MVPGGGLVAPLRGSLGVEDDVKIVVVEDSGGVGEADTLFLCLDFYWWFIFARIGK